NADFIELELEGNVRGASRSWKTELAHACLQLPYRIEATSFPGHVETSPNAVVTPLLNRVNTQAYSVVNRVDVKGKVTLDHRYGPGHMQEMAIKDALQSPPWERNWNAPVIGVGLALYDQ